MSQLLPGQGRRFPSYAAWLAFIAALIACIAGAIAYYLHPSRTADVASPGPPPITVSVAASRPVGNTAEDPAVGFRNLAMVGQKFTPEWLVRVKGVYWTGTGALWAETTMPNSATERVFTIEKICQKLTEYAQSTGREWHGVSVRAVGGAELHTRAQPTDSCRPAA